MTSADSSVPPGADVPGAERTVRVAVLGCGNVGAALVGILQDRAEALAVQAGARFELAGIAVSDLDAPRPAHVPRELLTADPAAGLAQAVREAEAAAIKA